MSTKQFISAEAHLAKQGITVQQAQDFIFLNLNDASSIYFGGIIYGVTNNMFAELTNFSKSVIGEYFTSNNLDPAKLDRNSVLINSDLDDLGGIVDFNNNNGILSNDSLREKVQPLLDFPSDLDTFFGPHSSFHTNDGVYDPEELGVGHLGNVPATDETIESLFYGTLLNIFEKLDNDEFNQINQFPDEGDFKLFQDILREALSDTPTPTIAQTEEKLADLVSNEAARIINGYEDSGLVGILDASYIGLATA